MFRLFDDDQTGKINFSNLKVGRGGERERERVREGESEEGR